MKCVCGYDQRRTEQTLPSGHRRITLQCHTCFRREVELRTRSGALIRWYHDRHNPNGEKDEKVSRLTFYADPNTAFAIPSDGNEPPKPNAEWDKLFRERDSEPPVYSGFSGQK